MSERAASRPLDRDRLHMLPRDIAIRDAHNLLRPANQLDPEDMVAAIAVLFATVCSRVQIDPEEAHTLGLRMLRDQQHHDKANKLLQSLRDFAGLRIAGQEVTYS